MADYTMKADDTFPFLTAILSDQVGPVDLTAAASCKFIMKHATGSPVVIGVATIVLPQTGDDLGKVIYDWAPADTSTVGTYDVEFQVTWSAGNIETYPNDGYKSLEIKADLGD